MVFYLNLSILKVLSHDCLKQALLNAYFSAFHRRWTQRGTGTLLVSWYKKPGREGSWKESVRILEEIGGDSFPLSSKIVSRSIPVSFLFFWMNKLGEDWESNWKTMEELRKESLSYQLWPYHHYCFQIHLGFFPSSLKILPLPNFFYIPGSFSDGFSSFPVPSYILPGSFWFPFHHILDFTIYLTDQKFLKRCYRQRCSTDNNAIDNDAI